jgi:hypothetical protein
MPRWRERESERLFIRRRRRRRRRRRSAHLYMGLASKDVSLRV